MREDQPDPVSGGLGYLQVRLAENEADILAIQALRHEVFKKGDHQSDGLHPYLERDGYDQHCDHLMVVDESPSTLCPEQCIVGTYRLLRQEIAIQNCGFYSSNEFLVAPMIERHPKKRFLELGRSCVRSSHRAKRTIELLWHGTWSYILHHKIDVLFGCASFPSSDPDDHKEALGYLHQFHMAQDTWQVAAGNQKFVDLEGYSKTLLEPRKAIRQLPPLIKGYLRLGAVVGPHAVVDEAFGSTDIFIVLPVSSINPKYISFYGPNAERHRTI